MLLRHPEQGVRPKECDRFRLVYITFGILGIGTLLPWNVVLTETDYFLVRSHVPPTAPSIANNFPAVLANSYTIMNLLAFLLLLPTSKYIPVHHQIIVPLWMVLLVLASQAWLSTQAQISGEAVMAISVSGGALLGAAASLLLCGAYTLASRFPPIYTQAVVAGQGLAGLAVSLLSFLTTWLYPPHTHTTLTPEDVRPAAFAYFTGAAGVMAWSLLGYLTFPYLPFAQQHTVPEELVLQPLAEAALEQPPTGNLHQALLRPSPGVSDMAGRVQRKLRRSSSRLASEKAAERAEEALAPQHIPSLREMLSHLRHFHWIVGFTFAVTYFAFPAITSHICSVRNAAERAPCHPGSYAGRLYGDLFVPLSFVLFNGGDFVGRFAGGLHRQPPETVLLWTYAVLRLALVAGLMLCHVITPSPWLLPDVFRSDAAALILVALLGLSNGHLATVTVMHAPALLPEIVRDQCGTIMAFSITSGLAIGVLVGLVTLPRLQL